MTKASLLWFCQRCKAITPHRVSNFPDKSDGSTWKTIKGIRVYVRSKSCDTCLEIQNTYEIAEEDFARLCEVDSVLAKIKTIVQGMNRKRRKKEML